MNSAHGTWRLTNIQNASVSKSWRQMRITKADWIHSNEALFLFWNESLWVFPWNINLRDVDLFPPPLDATVSPSLLIFLLLQVWFLIITVGHLSSTKQISNICFFSAFLNVRSYYFSLFYIIVNRVLWVLRLLVSQNKTFEAELKNSIIIL